MTRTMINEDVYVTAVAFRNNRDYAAEPRRMEYRGASVSFLNGLHYLVKKGDQVLRIFDMSDAGGSTYRLLSNENQSSWRLVTITRSI